MAKARPALDSFGRFDDDSTEFAMENTMSMIRAAMVSGALIVFVTGSAAAGPCSDEITRAQIELDARIAANISSAPAAAESVDAKLHHQPTPASLARAGKQVHDEEAAAALARARTADARGDGAECQKALKEFRGFTN